MSLEQLSSIAAPRPFLEGMQSVAFGITTNNQERYQWVKKTGQTPVSTAR